MAEMENSSSMTVAGSSLEETITQQNFPVKKKRNLPGNPGKKKTLKNFTIFFIVSPDESQPFYFVPLYLRINVSSTYILSSRSHWDILIFCCHNCYEVLTQIAAVQSVKQKISIIYA